MMFSSADLRYIELEMLHAILAESESYPWQFPKLISHESLNGIKTSTDFYQWVNESEHQRWLVLRQLKQLLQNEAEESSRKDPQRPSMN